MQVNSYFIHKAVPGLKKWVANYFDEDVELLHCVSDAQQVSTENSLGDLGLA